MKRHSALTWLFVLLLALVPAWGVWAKEPLADGARADVGRLLPAPDSQTAGAASPAAASVALGPSGLAYRYVETFGVAGEAYPGDSAHLNLPQGLSVDGADNLFVAEPGAGRMLRFNSSATHNLTLGVAGRIWSLGNDTFNVPNEAAVASNGNIWVTDEHRIVEYDAAGTFQQQLPDQEPWASGSDNGHFNAPNGLVFDSAGRLYVSDEFNQRIQVYSFITTTPTYSATIGLTGVITTTDNGFNQPQRLAIDSLDRLYVADGENFRVQRCEYSGAWSCSTFFGETGVHGSDDSHLGFVEGVAVDSSDRVYIADSWNHRVVRCDSDGSDCIDFAGESGVSGTNNAHFNYVGDVAVDSAGRVYVADRFNHRVQKFNSAGVYQNTLGTPGVPYVVDDTRLNAPRSIAPTSDGGLVVAESRGLRLIKLDASGAQQWTAGEAGVFGADNTHFSDWWTDNEMGVAVAPGSQQVYLADTGNHRLQVYNSAGVYQATFGSLGTGNYQFNCPAGLDFNPGNGNLVVADLCNQRIMVYTSAHVFKAMLGETGVAGSDNSHFNVPLDVAVAANGVIYVADAENFRVQKCTLSGSTGTCSTFAGETGVFGDDFGHLHPVSVAVDGAGRVFVLDDWNGRVLVYDSTGAFLTSVGGGPVERTNGFQSAIGVAVDAVGNLYISDRFNHVIKKFAPGVPGWRQSNLNGFGNRLNNNVPALEVFGGQLYAGSANGTEGGRVWRTADGSQWTAVSAPGFGQGAAIASVVDLAEFKGQLYAGTGWSEQPGQLWRSPNGTAWTAVVTDAFGDASPLSITTLQVYSGTLYAAANSGPNGVQVWRSATGNSLSWTNVITGGNGNANSNYLTDFIPFNGALFAGVENPDSGLQIWRSVTGNAGDWDIVVPDGFGSADNNQTGGFAIFGGQLYVGTRNDVTGAQLWRSADGITWAPVIQNGLGSLDNYKLESLHVLGNGLYAGFNNWATGLEVWMSTDGTTWSQINPDGFGDNNNESTLWSNAVTTYQGSLYIGTGNHVSGGEIWARLQAAYLPLIGR